MPRRFAEIAFTDSVKAAQTHYGSRDANRNFDQIEEPVCILSAREREFIEARDGFYQATVGDQGWPYVQFRGGPPGFLKVLDQHTLGYADFRGNVQYISVGNLSAEPRIALLLMDYPNRRRLKIWARAQVVDADDDPHLIERLEMPSYRARVERAIVLTVEAFDWNCPQHITPRYTETEIEEQLAPLRAQLAAAQIENRALRAQSQAHAKPERPETALGHGPLALVVTGIRQLTATVRAYELAARNGEPLPVWTPGAHLSVPVQLDGREETRAYSLAGDPDRRDRYLIAIRHDEQGRGGSLAAHRDYALGSVLHCSLPDNQFPLHDDDRPALLIAGGIGVTPLRAMALSLRNRSRRFTLHAIAPTPDELPFGAELRQELGPAVRFWFTREPGAARPRMDELLADLPDAALVYACGPGRMLDAIREAADQHQIAAERIRFERFSFPPSDTLDRPIRVELRRSGITLAVPAHQSVLDAAIAAGIEPRYDCRVGTCGTCAVKLLAGEPEHRDTTLSPQERDRAGLFCVCVSRAAGQHLVLDL